MIAKPDPLDESSKRSLEMAYAHGIKEGLRQAQAQQQADQNALAAHWEDGTKEPGR